MRLLISCILVMTLIVPAFASASGAAIKDELLQQTITVAGTERTYYVHYPRNQQPATPRALVFVLHGGGGADAETMASRTGMSAIADREGFVVVYPAGVDGQWNDGRGKTFRRAKDNSDVDDVGFISTVIDRFVQSGVADGRRVYAMGMSNGGMMTHRLGIELGDKLAAIAAVIANLPANLQQEPPQRPLPVLIMNGTKDPMMPWSGGAVHVLGRDYGEVLSTEATLRYWLSAAKLQSTPVMAQLEDRAPRDGCRAEEVSYRQEGRAEEVVLYRMVGGGHNLPGGNTPDRPRLLGPKCLDINGAEVIWSFFKRH